MFRTFIMAAAVWLAACGTQVSSESEARGTAALKERLSLLERRLMAVEPRRPDEAARVLAEREREWVSLAEVDARAMLERAMPERALAQVARRFPEAAAKLEQRGQWEGELEVLVVDAPSPRESRTEHYVTVGGERHRVFFGRAMPKGLRSGLKVKLRGLRMARVLVAEELEVDARESARSEATGVCASTGEQRGIILLAAFPGQAQPALTKQQVRDVFFSQTQRSLDGYWREASEGRTSIKGDVAGWYTLDRAYGCNETDAMREAALRAADADVDFSRYDRVFIVHPMPQSGCYYAGLATLMCGALATRDGEVRASTAWLVANYLGSHEQGVELVTHEAGHNLSLNHASSRDFDTEPLGPVGVQGTLTEYGDTFSTMGTWNPGHYAAPHKARLGWLAPTSVAEVENVGGSFTLNPFSMSGGLKALKVRRGAGDDWLWLEYRQPVGGYDVALGTKVFGGALVHYEDTWSRDATHLLDFAPETSAWDDPALLPGTMWADPYSNLSVTVRSATPTGLTVDIHYDETLCEKMPPEVRVTSFSDTIWPGGRPEFEILITNRDSVGCAPSTFQLGALVPAGWGAEPLSAQVTLAPSSAVYEYLQTYVPYSAVPGTYSAGATVTRDGQTVRATDSVELVERCIQAPPTLSLSPPMVTAAPGSEATWSVTVTNNDSASCNWVWYDFGSNLPEGWETSFSEWGVNLPPGGAFTFNFSKLVPVGASGSHGVDLVVYQDEVGQVASTTASVEVSASLTR
jgi:M6 family metalloprotease-like protein